MDFLDVLGEGSIIGVIFTIIGTCIGIFLTKKWGAEQHKKLGDIDGKLSTTFIGTFPNYLENVSEFIESAKSTLDIMCTYPQHGAFSNPKGWQHIDLAIQKVIYNKDVAVRMVFSSSDQRLFADTHQFSDAFKDWQRWYSENNSKLIEYICCHGDVDFPWPNGQDLSSDDRDINNPYEWLWFQDEAEKTVAKAWASKNSKVRIKESPHLMPLFVWIVDEGREAIFVVMTYDNNSLGHAFKTSDRGIISALTELVERYQSDSESFNFNPRSIEDVESKVRKYRQATEFSD